MSEPGHQKPANEILAHETQAYTRQAGVPSDQAVSAISMSRRPVPSLDEPLHENPLVHRVLASRGLTRPEELDCSLRQLPVPDALPHIEQAVDRLLLARENAERVLIVGDYDCDGATSTAVAMLGLSMLGFSHLDYLIPSRFKFGYGLSPSIVDIAHRDYQAQLIITVDNGVASVEGVEQACILGMDVVVTDHHLAPEVLPKAVAIVNPNLPSAAFEGCHLAGVGVIFYTLLALRSRLRQSGDACSNAALVQLLDLVAIGTIADVVPLDRINRILVEQGLKRIRAGQTRPGVLALLKVASRAANTLSTQDIGFGIGPRLNAAGRLEDMRVGVRCLMSDNEAQAATLASELNRLNQKRQGIEATMRSDAQAQLQALSLDSDAVRNTFGLCLHDDDWHQGVIGILAGRLKESLYKPVVVFTADDEHNLKGSARSIPGVHIRDVLQNIVARHPGMIAKFGGHAMAAGLTLPRDSLQPFREAFNDAVRIALDGVHSLREFLTDGPLAEAELTLDNAQLLSSLMPWGQGFEAPVFDGTFRIVSQKVVGKGHLKLLLEAADSNRRIDGIAFNQTPVAAEGELLHVVYALDANWYRDRCSLQLRVQHLEVCALR